MAVEGFFLPFDLHSARRELATRCQQHWGVPKCPPTAEQHHDPGEHVLKRVQRDDIRPYLAGGAKKNPWPDRGTIQHPRIANAIPPVWGHARIAFRVCSVSVSRHHVEIKMRAEVGDHIRDGTDWATRLVPRQIARRANQHAFTFSATAYRLCRLFDLLNRHRHISSSLPTVAPMNSPSTRSRP